MRKKLHNLFIGLLIGGSVYSQDNIASYGVEGLANFSKSYFRSDPFNSEFSVFLKHLINDPDISNKVIRKKTDTSFYKFSGTYKTYNPFFFKPKRLQILLEETQVEYDDSLNTKDTVFIYQLQAYDDDNDKSLKEIKKEFEKIHRQNNKKFYDSKSDEEKDGVEITAAGHDYFVAMHWLSPLSIAWAKIISRHEIVLALTLRFKISANEAVLPAVVFTQ